VTGDFNGDGKTDISVFRNGLWFLDYNIDGWVDRGTNFGFTGDKPVIGKWS
jgi:hypothetical protein